MSLLIHRSMCRTTTNGQQKYIAVTNNRTVLLMTEDFLLFVTKNICLKGCLSKL